MTTINPYSDEMLIDPCINDSEEVIKDNVTNCLLYTSPSPRDRS